MLTKYIDAGGIKLACYIQNPGQTSTIFFIHGNSSSSQVWRKQLCSSLLQEYRLICIDMPCHGNSAELDGSGDFSLSAIAAAVAEGVKQLMDGQPCIICSISLGTNVVSEMLLHGAAPLGLLFAGPCIIGEGFDMNTMVQAGADMTALFADNLPAEQVEKYAAAVSLSPDIDDRNLFLLDYYSVKGNFRSSLYASIAAGRYNDHIAAVVKAQCPVCIVFGEGDKIVNTHYLDNAPFDTWNNLVYKIPGASHLVNIDAPEQFNDLLASFAGAIFTADDSYTQN